jgi:hypothetical protein
MKIDFFQKDVVLNQCVRLINSLVIYSYISPVEEVKLATVGIIAILGNIRSVIKKILWNFSWK